MEYLRERCAGLEQTERDRRQAEESLKNKAVQLEAIYKGLVTYLGSGNWREASACLLRAVLEQTSSEYGFIGVMVEGPTLRILAHEGMVWDRHTNREFYDHAIKGYEELGFLEFRRFNNLFGHVITTGRPVLANDPSTDTRAGGLPPGHPPLKHFLGVPAIRGSEVVGLIGVANRPGGYTGAEQTQLEILTEAVGALYECYRRHEREVALEAKLRQRQKMESLGQLAAGIAHDFNNLLTVINGYSELLQVGMKSDDSRHEELEQIRAAGRRGAALIRQLLAFSRLQPMSVQVIDVNTVVTEMMALLQRVLGKGIDIQLDLARDLGTVRMDRIQLEQVLMNLVVNAKDAMPKGGRITITTGNVLIDEPFTQCHPGSRMGMHAVLTLKDTGTGMDAATQARIFEPFFTTKEPGKGTGLGLATVFGIVKQSGGYIDVESALNHGSTFRLYIPWATTEAKREIVSATPTSKPVTILLVEDDTMIRTILRETLSKQDYQVLEAANGAEALEVVRAHHGEVALLIADIVLGDVNGLEVAQSIKTLEPAVKELFISGYTEDVLAHHGVRLSSLNFLPKPLMPSTFVSRVREVLTSP
ncbi:ATP-binding protein [Candidatus Nitrospira bockiana]